MAARRPFFLSILGVLAAAAPAVASAQSSDPTLRDSFAIGDKGGSLCEVQATVRDSVIEGMFDRAWMILCRDASQPVGYVRMLRASPADAQARIERARAGTIVCTAPDRCAVKDSDVQWNTRIEGDGRSSYAVEGFAAYNDALNLALESIRQRKLVSGVINVATTSIGGNDGFARTLAGTIDVDRALAEGYRRNHSGDYAEAAEFFEALSRRALEEQSAADIDPTEFTLNRALQKSNLGEFAEAERLFGEVEAIPTTDPVQLRLRRNFRAIHALNQRDYRRRRRPAQHADPAADQRGHGRGRCGDADPPDRRGRQQRQQCARHPPDVGRRTADPARTRTDHRRPGGPSARHRRTAARRTRGRQGGAAQGTGRRHGGARRPRDLDRTAALADARRTRARRGSGGRQGGGGRALPRIGQRPGRRISRNQCAGLGAGALRRLPDPPGPRRRGDENLS
ncbi:hypothetical protein [Sphingopyxis sp. PET50]|uniref:hypothetical protein n=1 Tax=Sphingopyxis sp. PET50 TaxID=2976533 RepID=UPI0021AF0C39|nr:hypothetical protein [Sphingopyxis sp. PET50]